MNKQWCRIRINHEQKRLGNYSQDILVEQVYDIDLQHPLCIGDFGCDCTNAVGEEIHLVITTIVQDILPTEMLLASCSVRVPKVQEFRAVYNYMLAKSVAFHGFFYGRNRSAAIVFQLTNNVRLLIQRLQVSKRPVKYTF